MGDIPFHPIADIFPLVEGAIASAPPSVALSTIAMGEDWLVR